MPKEVKPEEAPMPREVPKGELIDILDPKLRPGADRLGGEETMLASNDGGGLTGGGDFGGGDAGGGDMVA